MPRKKPSDETICHVTDAVGVVHLALVKRQLTRERRVLAFSISTACAPKVVAWNAKLHGDGNFPTDLPEAFDLPKKVTDAGLMVKYEPESLLAPTVTCVQCIGRTAAVQAWEP